MSTGRDLSHHNPVGNYAAARAGTDWVHLKITESTSFVDPMAVQHHRGFAGIPRGAYHFARPVSIPAQVTHFLARKKAIGPWERFDMLDCEFLGVTARFIRDLVAEYRQQSGNDRVYVYSGVYELNNACRPELWWDPGCLIWAARYRKIGAPPPVAWATHLGFDHPGLAVYQWDNATALPGAGPTDINTQRIEENTDMTPDEHGMLIELLQRTRSMHYNGFLALPETPQFAGDLTWFQQQLNASRLQQGLDALSDDEVKIIAAIRAAGGADAEAIATFLAPLMPVGATVEETTAAAIEGVRLAFERAGT